MTPRQSLARLAAFGGVSAVGLATDCGVFMLLLTAGLPPMPANLFSAAAGVSLVYAVSVRRIFEYQGRFLARLFIIYASWQIAAVTSASWAVGALSTTGLLPLVAKLLILPVTFGANFMVMRRITANKETAP